MQVKIDKATAAFGKVNPRVEIHGDSKVAASDVVVTIATTHEVIAMFTGDDDLHHALFYKDDRVKVPLISPIVVNRTVENCEVTIYDNPNSSIKLTQVTLKDPTMELNPGRSISLSMKLQAHYGKGQLERLAALMGNQAVISISEMQSDLFDDDGDSKKEPEDKKAAPKKKATKKKAPKKKAPAKKDAPQE